ncbi:DUF4097 domain-containing protein [Acidiferrimicrobium sp. IK]|uniref:DUF4097 domain-containing protein n=1 Tax=Acidiferrimicrobium sp. IK TaxID=2871700 RepID=UPI0021CAEBA2|nr:DUF4097 domain-containing protein [Acidiferrimicrobium sp. IK]MCU4184772.1 DUF4097 domain-containing protein [Acidiferrimicrobium sp. IK]
MTGPDGTGGSTFGVIAPASHARGWRAAGLSLLVVALVGAGWSVLGNVARQPIHHSRSFAGPVTAVDVDVSNGSVTVVAGPGQGVRVVAAGDRGLSTPSDDEQLAGGVLKIRSGCALPLDNTWCRLSYTVTAPAGAAVYAHSGNGTVTVSGVHGDVDASSGNGTVRLSGLGGALRAHSGNGSVIAVGLADPTVTASSGNGSVSLAFAAAPLQVGAHSGNGTVTVTVPAASGPYHVIAGAHTTIEIPTDPTAARTINASSSNGSVRLRSG